MASTVNTARAWLGRLSGLVLGFAASLAGVPRFPNPFLSIAPYPVCILIATSFGDLRCPLPSR